jgi:arginase family enzyme
VSQEDVDWVNSSKVTHTQLCFYDRDIKQLGLKISNLEKPPITEFRSAVCIDLSSLKAEFAPGVSEPNPVSGFTLGEMTDILLDLVDQGRDRVFAITEFNPAIEKFKTCGTIINLVETLIQGWLKEINQTKLERMKNNI